MKKINWKLISDIAVIISMTAVLIGYLFLATEIQQCKQRLDNLESITIKNKINKVFGE